MRKRVTFEADDVKLFDALRAAGGNTDGLGGRMVSALLSDPTMAELIGMEVFGVTYIGHDDETERYRIALEQIKALRDGYQGGDKGRKAAYRVAGGIAEKALRGKEGYPR
jgi:hypothetical protein